VTDPVFQKAALGQPADQQIDFPVDGAF